MVSMWDGAAVGAVEGPVEPTNGWRHERLGKEGNGAQAG